MAGEATVVAEGFAVVGALHLEGGRWHGRGAEGLEDAVEGDEPEGLLHLGCPAGVAGLDVGLKGREIVKHLVLHVGRFGRRRNQEGQSSSWSHRNGA